jgi:hypothetical protein
MGTTIQMTRGAFDMKERAIIFSAPMVRAILAGPKTQTRREVKVPGVKSNLWGGPLNYRGVAIVRADVDYLSVPGVGSVFCPYGQPGDRLFVREAFRLCQEADEVSPRDSDPGYRVWYEADKPHQPGAGRLRPSIHMPRWASRITLEVTGVRVERLQDISKADAVAEGVRPDCRCLPDDDTAAFNRIGKVRGNSFPIARYAALWESINGPGSWDANPWVWVVEFKRVG